MTSKLEQLRQDESTSQQKQSNFDLLYTLYKDSSQEQSLQQFIDDYSQGEKVPSDVRALYVTGDRKQAWEISQSHACLIGIEMINGASWAGWSVGNFDASSFYMNGSFTYIA